MSKHRKLHPVNFASIKENEKKQHRSWPFNAQDVRSTYIKVIIYLIIALLAVGLLIGIALGIRVHNLRVVINESRTAKLALEQAESAMMNKNFSIAKVNAQAAENSLVKAEKNLTEIQNSWLVNKIPVAQEEGDYLGLILASGRNVSQATAKLANIGLAMGMIANFNTRFSAYTDRQKLEALDYLWQLGPELSDIGSRLEASRLILEQNRGQGYLPFVRSSLAGAGEELNNIQLLIGQISLFSNFIPPLLGYPEEMSVLLAVYDPLVQQANGGRIELLGMASINNGTLDNVEIVNTKTLADFNQDPEFWGPDWGNNAEHLIETLNKNKEDWPEPQLAVQVSIDALADIFQESQHLEYNMGQTNSEVAKNFLQTGKAREIYFKHLIEEIWSNWQEESLRTISGRSDALNEHLINKTILLYFSDRELNDQAAEAGWSGELNTPADDMIAASLIRLNPEAGPIKISHSLAYRLSEGENGLFAELRASFSHQEQKKVPVYVKLFVPAGCRLNSVRLPDGEELKEEDISVYREIGQTAFGVNLEIEPREVNSFVFYYKLPDRIESSIDSHQAYELMVWHQPGLIAEPLMIDFDFENKVKSYIPTGFHVSRLRGGIQWESNLDQDKKFTVKF